MFKHYNFESNVKDNCFWKAVTLMFLLLSFFFHHSHKKTYYYSLFKRLIYEIQNNLHQLTTLISTLIMWHNWKYVYHEIGIPRPKIHDIEIPRPKNHDIEIWGLKHHDIKKWRQISHDIVIPRPFFRG